MTLGQRTKEILRENPWFLISCGTSVLSVMIHNEKQQRLRSWWLWLCFGLGCIHWIYRRTLPLSGDAQFLRAMPLALSRTILRRVRDGPLYPEWTFLMEIVQSVLKCVSLDYGDRLLTTEGHLDVARENINFFTKFYGTFQLYRFGYHREHVTLHHHHHHHSKKKDMCLTPVAVECVWYKPQRSDVHVTGPAKSEKPYVLFHLHGSGYVGLTPLATCEMVVKMMQHMKRVSSGAIQDIHAFAMDYRKAPEHVFPAAVEDAMAGYQYLIDHCGIHPTRIIFAGESAGGGLVLSLLLALKRTQRLPFPAASIILSPLVDLKTDDDPDAEHDWISDTQLKAVRALYIPPDGQDWMEASPVHNDLTGLPPIFIQVGDRDLLYPSCLRLATRAKVEGVETVLDVHPNMPHVFTAFSTYLIPSAPHGLEKIAQFAVTHFLKQDRQPQVDESLSH